MTGIEEEAIRLFFLTTPWQYQPIYGEANHVFDWFDGLRCRLLNAKGEPLCLSVCSHAVLCITSTDTRSMPFKQVLKARGSMKLA